MKRRKTLEEQYIYRLNRTEMKSRIQGLTGFEEERKKIKRLSKLIFGSTGEKISEYFEFLNINGNVLLFGKPGTGKTSICYECMLEKPEASFYQVNMSFLISEKLGRTSRLITELFEKVISEAQEYPIFLLIEEVESFLPNREFSRDLEDMKRALTVFMQYMDKRIHNLMILCTTNYIENLDPAIIRRFSYIFEVTNPDKKAVLEFLTSDKNPFAQYFKNKTINEKIADQVVSKKMTFSDIKANMRAIVLENENIDQMDGRTLLNRLSEENER